MTESRKKIVWVLGAGFSHPLGAPLLVHFFSDESLEEVRGLYPNGDYPVLHGQPATIAWALYWWGRREKKLTNGGDPRNLWQDAEQFLSYLDAAVSAGAGNHRWRYLSRVVEGLANRPIDLRGIRAAARQLLAAECMAFLEDADLEAEYWHPFLRWGKELVGVEDTILCFNYDLAPERIKAHLGSSAAYDTVLPVPKGHFEPNAGAARLLKPHGSVDWVLREGGRVERLDNPRQSLLTKDDELVLGTPGPSKLQITKSLEPLWEEGQQALREADAVVFVGYRFPPSDTEACRRLMGALRGNTKPHVAAHIVLGPEVGRPDVRRLQEMLKITFVSAKRGPYGSGTVQSCTVLPQPMYSQDFFLLFTRDLITGPTEL